MCCSPPPANVVRLDPDAPDTVFVGTDVGVYVSRDGARTWSAYAEGMPIMPVIDLSVDRGHRKIYAATFGRSIYAAGL